MSDETSHAQVLTVLRASLIVPLWQVSEAIMERKSGELIHKRMKGMVADRDACVKELKEQRHKAYMVSYYSLFRYNIEKVLILSKFSEYQIFKLWCSFSFSLVAV